MVESNNNGMLLDEGGAFPRQEGKRRQRELGYMMGMEDRFAPSRCLALNCTKQCSRSGAGLLGGGFGREREHPQQNQEPESKHQAKDKSVGSGVWLLWVCCCKEECEQFLGTLSSQDISVIKEVAGKQ